MKSLEIALLTRNGDVVAVEPVMDVSIADADENSPTGELPVEAQMERVHRAILATIRRAGARPAMDVVAFQILVGRSLMRPHNHSTVRIPIPVEIYPEDRSASFLPLAAAEQERPSLPSVGAAIEESPVEVAPLSDTRRT